MIEFLIECMFDGFIELIIRFLSKYVKKKNPDYDKTVLKRTLTEIFIGIIVIVILIICCIVVLLLIQLSQKLIGLFSI